MPTTFWKRITRKIPELEKRLFEIKKEHQEWTPKEIVQKLNHEFSKKLVTLSIKGFSGKLSFFQVRAKLAQKGLKRETSSKATLPSKASSKEEKSKDLDREKFIDFLSRGRSYKEIEDKFGLTRKCVDEELHKEIKGYRLFVQQGRFNESLFIFLPKDSKEIKTKERIWSYRLEPNGDPYIIIEFPDNLKWKNIKVVPISDVLFDSPEHNAELFDEYIHWISRTDRVFTFFNGDIFYDKVVDPSETILKFRRKISRIAHKILWMQQGDLEAKGIWKKKKIDPLEVLHKDFGIPYFLSPVYADIFWKKHIYTFFCFHGRTSAQKKGTKLNAAIRPLEFQEFVMFTVMSHARDSITDDIIRECRDPVNFDIEAKPQHVIICPGFLRYFDTIQAQKGYAPSSQGAVSCNLYPNGDYHLSV